MYTNPGDRFANAEPVRGMILFPGDLFKISSLIYVVAIYTGPVEPVALTNFSLQA